MQNTKARKPSLDYAGRAEELGVPVAYLGPAGSVDQRYAAVRTTHMLADHLETVAATMGTTRARLVVEGIAMVTNGILTDNRFTLDERRSALYLSRPYLQLVTFSTTSQLQEDVIKAAEKEGTTVSEIYRKGAGFIIGHCLETSLDTENLAIRLGAKVDEIRALEMEADSLQANMEALDAIAISNGLEPVFDTGL